jgi:hypothetical protein
MNCNKENDPAPLPAYIHIDTIAVSVIQGQGTDMHLITEAWVYTDSVFQGAFHVPTTFPILGKGEINIDIFPGIRVNGQGSSPDIYPLMTVFSQKMDLNTLEETLIKPIFTYHPKARFTFVEDFETGNIFTNDIDQDPETHLLVSKVSSGRKSASGTLSASHTVLEVATNFIYENIPSDGSPVFFEMEYKGDIPLAVGLRGHQTGISPSTQYKLILVPREDWQKIYINFSDDLKRSQLSGYQVIFRSQFDSSLSQAEQKIFLDNLKLLHF